MNIKDKFYARLRQEGLCEDAARELEKFRLLSDVICERYMILKRFKELKQPNKTVGWVLSELADEFSKSEEMIKYIVYNK